MAVYFQDPATLTLRGEAIWRVREMQQRAQSSIQQQNQNPNPNPNPPIQPSPESSRQNPPQHAVHSGNAANPMPPNNLLSQLLGGAAAQNRQNRRPQPPPKGIADLLKRQGMGESLGSMGQSLQSTVSSVSQPIADILDSFGIDGEKLIILMVMWAVFNEQKDNKTLLLALGYLLI